MARYKKRRSRRRRISHTISIGRLRLKPKYLAVSLIIVALAALLYPLLMQPAEGEVVKVVDGDTIEVYIEGKRERVRLLGIDTPELHRPEKGVEPFAQEASDYTRRRLSGRRVKLIRDPDSDDRDKYGRLLRFVELPDGSDFSAELVEEGYARVLLDYSCSRKQIYLDLQKEARESGVGMWGRTENVGDGSDN